MKVITDWRQTARSIALQTFFLFLQTGGGQPGVVYSFAK